MDDSKEQQQFQVDESLRPIEDFLRSEFDAEVNAIRESKSAMITRITKASAAHLPQPSLRINTTKESAAPFTERESHPSSLTIQSADRRIRWWSITSVAAAALLILGLTVMISIYSHNNTGNPNTDNIASSKIQETQPLPSSLDDDTLAFEISEIERDLDQLQSDLNDSPVGETDSYLAASQLDDAINQFEADLETF